MKYLVSCLMIAAAIASGCSGGGGGGGSGGGGGAGPGPGTQTRQPLGMMESPTISISVTALDPLVAGQASRFELVIGSGSDDQIVVSEVRARIGALFVEDPAWTVCTPGEAPGVYTVEVMIPAAAPGNRLILSLTDSAGDSQESSVEELRLP